jgi:hypothetical protein
LEIRLAINEKPNAKTATRNPLPVQIMWIILAPRSPTSPASPAARLLGGRLHAVLSGFAAYFADSSLKAVGF